MSVQIDVEGLDELLENLGALENAVGSVGEGLQESIEENLMPELRDASASVWQVRTGNYSNGWVSERTGPEEVTVSNTVDYSEPLETGWTTRAGTFVESPGVLLPTSLASVERVAQGLIDWLMNRVGL